MMKPLQRRDFIKAGTALGAAFITAPSLTSAHSDVDVPHSSVKSGTPGMRTLGAGKNTMEVSPVGLGCMGMSYHRSFIPERKYMITLLRKAADMGVNLFDTAEAYGYTGVQAEQTKK